MLDFQENVLWSFAVLDSLDPNQKYQLAFSGGKDSHALLAVYIAWCEYTGKRLDLIVIFSDTHLEAPSLYSLIDKAQAFCESKNIPFVKVFPETDKSYWVGQFGLGYPVPNHINRWCTKELKVVPMKSVEGIVLAGSHSGESSKRDSRLKGCGSSECGIDKIANKVEPIATWTNCDVWDFIMLYGDDYLYEGASNNLAAIYDIQDSSDSSLRMGCFMCPVVDFGRILAQSKDGTIPGWAVDIRSLLEELRTAPRIRSIKTKEAGAILVDTRIQVWEKLKTYFPRMLEYGWITDIQINRVEELLAKRSYPKSYTKEWIIDEEKQAKPWIANPIFENSVSGSDDWVEDSRFNSIPTVKTIETKGLPKMQNLSNLMTYNLPAIKGKQGNHQYFVAQIPYAVLFNITVFDETTVSFNNQAQRPLEEARAKAITNYIENDPGNYVFNSLVVAIGNDVEFKAMSDDGAIGMLQLPIDCTCRIVDGQHRWHGIKEAVKSNPELKSDTVSVVFFLGDLSRVRQIFTDLNIHPKKPSASLSIAFDSRDDKSIIANTVYHSIPFMRKFTDVNSNTVTLKSGKLFSLNHVYKATQEYLKSYKDESIEVKKEKAVEFWEHLVDYIKDWQLVRDGAMTPKELKSEYLCTQAVTLMAIAQVARDEPIDFIKGIDWRKDNPEWLNILIDNSGKVMPGKKNATITANYLKTLIH